MDLRLACCEYCTASNHQVICFRMILSARNRTDAPRLTSVQRFNVSHLERHIFRDYIASTALENSLGSEDLSLRAMDVFKTICVLPPKVSPRLRKKPTKWWSLNSAPLNINSWFLMSCTSATHKVGSENFRYHQPEQG